MIEEEKTTDPTAEFITKALNAHGIFFKRKVREILDGCRITTGSIGEPIVAIVGEEYPVHYLQGASIDLLAEVRLGRERRLMMPIECKRAYTDRKRWVFFRDADARARFMYGISGRKVEFAQASAYKGFGDNVCVEGVEIDLGARDQYKAASADRIWEAAFQVCKCSEGFVLQELQERERHLSSEAQYMAVLPLLVTTAPLSICEVDAKSIDLTSGNVNGIARTTDVDWLVLSFPFTPSVALGGERLWVGPDRYAYPNERGFLLKRGITVVRVDALRKLMWSAYEAADVFSERPVGA